MAPPIDFGSHWNCVGIRRRYGHDIPLWILDGEPPQAFSDAYKNARTAMIDAGYSWTDRYNNVPGMSACWWDTGLSFDRDALIVEVGRVVAVAAAGRAERARREEERLAAEVAEVAPAAALIRQQLADMLRDRPWAFGRHIGEARFLLGVEDWTRHGLISADGHLSRARSNIERAAERLGRVPPAEWFAKAENAAIRAAALEGCQFLSSLDEDWAAVRNSQGWSQATCWTGHTLAERESLDQSEAAYALSLLHGHRRQLPDDLCLALFGEVFSRRRRRPAPEAPSLGL